MNEKFGVAAMFGKCLSCVGSMGRSESLVDAPARGPTQDYRC
jgi:hypothetical protein